MNDMQSELQYFQTYLEYYLSLKLATERSTIFFSRLSNRCTCRKYILNPEGLDRDMI